MIDQEDSAGTCSNESRINLREISEELLRFEVAERLWSLTIRGIPFWERVRFQVHQQMLQASGIYEQAHDRFRFSIQSLIRFAAESTRNTIAGNPETVGPSEYVFFGSPRRKLGENGNWWDIYCDPIIESLDGDSTYCEFPYRGRHLRPAQTQHIRYFDRYVITRYFAQRIAPKRAALPPAAMRMLQELGNGLSGLCGQEIVIDNLVQNSLVEREWMLPVYERFLGKARPSVVCLVCSYGLDTLVEACQRLDIKTAELQHGSTGPYHFGYHYPAESFKKAHFPDYMLLFGAFWGTLAEFPVPRERIRVVGFPYLESEIAKRRDHSRKRQIVFISQGTIGKRLSRMAAEFARDKRRTHSIVYKLHPGEFDRWHDEYPWLQDERIEVVANQRSLYEILAESELQVGVYSTAIFEGCAFGLGTVLIDLPGIELMQTWAEATGIPVISSVNELVERTVSPPAAGADSEALFASHALENMRKTLEELATT